MPQVFRGGRVAACLVGLSVLNLVAGCASASAVDSGPDTILVVSNSSVWSMVLDDLVCDGPITVRRLSGAEGDHHHATVTLKDRELLESADLVVRNGMGLDDNIEDLLVDSNIANLAVGDALAEAGRLSNDDPHIWLRPDLVAEGAALITDRLGELADSNGLEWDGQACETDLQERLDQVDAEIEAQIEGLADGCRVLLADHDSFGHFADRYQLEVLGSIVSSSDPRAEPLLTDLEALGEQVKASCVSGVLVNHADTTDAAATFAERYELRLLEVSAEGPSHHHETYEEMLRSVAEAVVSAAEPANLGDE